MEVRRKAAYQCQVPYSQRETISRRCESQVLTHRTPASTNTGILHECECSLVLVSFRDYGYYMLVSWSSFITGWTIGKDSQRGTIATLASTSLSWEHQENRVCIVDLTTVSLGIAVLEPKIRLLHHRGRVTFWLQGLDTHICELIRH